MRSVLKDVRHGLRLLVNSPSYAIVALLSLALGIGATTTVFSGVWGVLFRPFPFTGLNRMVTLSETIVKQGNQTRSVSLADFADWRKQNRTLDKLSACLRWSVNLTGTQDPERLEGWQVTQDFLPLLGMEPALGRFFSTEENAGRQGHAAVISHALWQRRFNSSTAVVGSSVTLDGENYTIVGVVPQDYDFPMGADIWAPLVETPEALARRGSRNLRVYARLAPGVTLRQAQAEMEHIAAGLAVEYPSSNAGHGARVQDLREALTFGSRQFVLTLWAAALFVLLLACANVANLQLARGTVRQKEIAIRAALGATRWRTVRQLLTESVSLALAGCAGGLLLGVWGTELMRRQVPPEVMRFVPGIRYMQMNTTVLWVTVVTAVLAGLVSGTAAAFQGAGVRPNETLKEGGRTTHAASARGRMRAALVVGEIALAMVLLVGAGLMAKTFWYLLEMHRGYDSHNVLTARLVLPERAYPDEHRIAGFYDSLIERLQPAGGVENTALVSQLPVFGGSTVSNFTIEGRGPAPAEEQMSAEVRVVSDQYFAALRIPVRKGRAIGSADGPDNRPVAVISETMARRFWAGQDPLEGRIRFGPRERDRAWVSIVGVVGDTTQDWFRQDMRPVIYVPYTQRPQRSMCVVMRTRGDPNMAAGTLRAAVSAIDSRQPLFEVLTLDAQAEIWSSGVRASAWTMAFFALIAMVLAATGIYAVMAYSVAQRTHEIGVRMALGADRRDVLGMVAGSAGRLLALGLSIGLVAAFALCRAMASLLENVTRVGIDAAVFAALAVLLAAVALLASYVPAWRATRVDPIRALHCE